MNIPLPKNELRNKKCSLINFAFVYQAISSSPNRMRKKGKKKLINKVKLIACKIFDREIIQSIPIPISIALMIKKIR